MVAMAADPVVAADRAAFREYLRDQRLPATPQRLAIADFVLGSDQHLSAEEIAQALDLAGTSVGTATIYRTLDVLVRSGLVAERDFGEGFRRFEATRGVPNHAHLHCAQCGTLLEFHDERLEQMTQHIADSHGFLRQGHRLVIHGLCSGCRRRVSSRDRERHR